MRMTSHSLFINSPQIRQSFPFSYLVNMVVVFCIYVPKDFRRMLPHFISRVKHFLTQISKEKPFTILQCDKNVGNLLIKIRFRSFRTATKAIRGLGGQSWTSSSFIYRNLNCLSIFSALLNLHISVLFGLISFKASITCLTSCLVPQSYF
ncbi:hypothetical protein BpHYR1_052074 [Brachionus plicatilis]|uniref:Uncharacterized protein n=1 Tax=Brachionus plicatilis TaxID=10195 RepID=A0A3M7R896_BRAPC|nr:hypothetical protein BpHYR1_052074 [Brachionus plicatilis]